MRNADRGPRVGGVPGLAVLFTALVGLFAMDGLSATGPGGGHVQLPTPAGQMLHAAEPAPGTRGHGGSAGHGEVRPAGCLAALGASLLVVAAPAGPDAGHGGMDGCVLALTGLVALVLLIRRRGARRVFDPSTAAAGRGQRRAPPERPPPRLSPRISLCVLRV